MTSLRSSVRPKSSKQPWGTIIRPNFGLGYQPLTGYELKQTVDRLSKSARSQEYRHYKMAEIEMNPAYLEAMVKRLSKPAKSKVEENPLKQIGIVNSFAWKGYN